MVQCSYVNILECSALVLITQMQIMLQIEISATSVGRISKASIANLVSYLYLHVNLKT